MGSGWLVVVVVLVVNGTCDDGAGGAEVLGTQQRTYN